MLLPPILELILIINTRFHTVIRLETRDFRRSDAQISNRVVSDSRLFI